jgi:cytochrome oxidase Cu insertion factor (SCO1/SenC/PrrC family)
MLRRLAFVAILASACLPDSGGNPPPGDGAAGDPDVAASGDPIDGSVAPPDVQLVLNGTPPITPKPAIDFTVTNRDGTTRTKADLLGHPTVIWFYPAAFTSG